jgi:hypothetical protein
MCEDSSVRYPSTLDLYAVHVLAESNPEKYVTLPANIPYQQSPIPVSEFQSTSTLIIFISVCSTVVLFRSSRRKHRQRS